MANPGWTCPTGRSSKAEGRRCTVEAGSVGSPTRRRVPRTARGLPVDPPPRPPRQRPGVQKKDKFGRCMPARARMIFWTKLLGVGTRRYG